jgi:hypothetical protein
MAAQQSKRIATAGGTQIRRRRKQRTQNTKERNEGRTAVEDEGRATAPREEEDKEEGKKIQRMKTSQGHCTGAVPSFSFFFFASLKTAGLATANGTEAKKKRERAIHSTPFPGQQICFQHRQAAHGTVTRADVDTLSSRRMPQDCRGEYPKVW